MKRKGIVGILLFTFVLTLFTGCKKTEEEGIQLYYMEAMGNGLVAQNYVLKGDTKEEQVKEVLAMLSENPESTEYRRLLPEGVQAKEIVFDKNTVTLNFNGEYNDLESYYEVLVRAGVVKSVLQIEDIDSVTFYVSNKPLQTKKGVLVGSMTSESFIDDYGEETDSLISATLNLYYASADGQSLVKKTQNIYYNKNIAKERLVIDNLIKGSGDADAISPLPSGTKLLNITTTDGVCYVNFNSSFISVDTGIASDVTLYAIVNSLTELDTINKVQILVEGNSVMPDNSMKFELGKSYERDTSRVMQAVERELLIEENAY